MRTAAQNAESIVPVHTTIPKHNTSEALEGPIFISVALFCSHLQNFHENVNFTICFEGMCHQVIQITIENGPGLEDMVG